MGRSLLLSGAILLLPLLMLFVQTIWIKAEEINSLKQQLQMLEWVSPLYGALDQASQYRGLREVSIHYPGYYDFAEEYLLTLEQQFSEQLRMLFHLQSELPENLTVSQEVESALHRIEALWLIQQGSDFSFSGMEDLIEHLNTLLVRLQPERAGLQRIVLQDIPSLREIIAALRGTGSGYLARAAATDSDLVRGDEDDPMLLRIERALWGSENQFLLLRNSLEDEKGALDERIISTLVELVSSIQEVRDLVEWELVDASIVSLSPEIFFEEASGPIYLLHTLAMDILQHIKLDIEHEIKRKQVDSHWCPNV